MGRFLFGLFLVLVLWVCDQLIGFSKLGFGLWRIGLGFLVGVVGIGFLRCCVFCKAK